MALFTGGLTFDQPILPFPASSDRDLRSYWVKVKGLPPRAGEASGGSDG